MGVADAYLFDWLFQKLFEEILESFSSLWLVMRAKFMSQICDASLNLVFVCVHECVVLDIVHDKVLCNFKVDCLRFQPGHMSNQIIS